MSAEGYPPANEYIAFKSTLLKISLTGERKNEATSLENLFVCIFVLEILHFVQNDREKFKVQNDSECRDARKSSIEACPLM